MKLNKILLASLVASAGTVLANSASAAVPTIYISGATTFRAPVTESLIDTTNSTSVLSDCTAAFSGSSLLGAGAAIFHGHLRNGGAEVYIKTYWTGSAAGVYDLAVNNPFLGWIGWPTLNGLSGGTIDPSGKIPVSPTVAGTQQLSAVSSSGGGTNLSTYLQYDQSAPTAVLSDSLGSTVTNEIYTLSDSTFGDNTSNGNLENCGDHSRNTSSNAVAKNTVGIAPILWVVGNSSVAPTFKNITQQTASSILQGPTSAQLFSGSTADLNNFVVLIGRNEDSGTRIAAMSEPQYTVAAPNGVKQFLPTFGGNVKTQGASPSGSNPQINEGGVGATVATLGLWPADWTLNTEANIDWHAPGHSGFTGGGDVANALAATNPVTGLSFAASTVVGDTTGSHNVLNNQAGGPAGFNGASQKVWLVGYIGVADAVGSGSIVSGTLSSIASTGTNSGIPNGTVLSYNGVSYTGPADVQNGAYTMWVLEHMYDNADFTAAGTTEKHTVDDIANALYVTYACTNSSGVYSPVPANAAGIKYETCHFTKSAEGAIQTTSGF